MSISERVLRFNFRDWLGRVLRFNLCDRVLRFNFRDWPGRVLRFNLCDRVLRFNFRDWTRRFLRLNLCDRACRCDSYYCLGMRMSLTIYARGVRLNSVNINHKIRIRQSSACS